MAIGHLVFSFGYQQSAIGDWPLAMTVVQLLWQWNMIIMIISKFKDSHSLIGWLWLPVQPWVWFVGSR